MFILCLIVLILPSVVKMAPLPPPDLNTKLEMCKFLTEKAVFEHEKYNAVANAGKLLKTKPDQNSSAQYRGENDVELDQCLGILRSKMGPKNHIFFKLLPYNKDVAVQSAEYGRQMEKLQQYFLNGREMANGFLMLQSLKYSENFFNRYLAEYFGNFHDGPRHLVDVILGIEPELWPAYLPPNGGQTMVVNKLVQLVPLETFPSGAVHFTGWANTSEGQPGATFDITKKGPNMTGFTFAMADEHIVDAAAMQPMFAVLKQRL